MKLALPFQKTLLFATAGLVAVNSLNVLLLQAQAPPTDAKPPAFEVASIKPSKSGSSLWKYDMQSGGRFVATNVSLINVISIAYGTPFPLPGFLIVGGPSWTNADR